MKRTYRMGVIGLGMGVNMLPVNNHPEIDIEVTHVAGTERRIPFMKDLQAKYGLAGWTTDYHELIGNPEIDIIGVFTPDAMHFEQCKDAILAGKHVICTKPMVVSLEEAKECVRLVDLKGVKFLVGQTMRYEPQFAALRTVYDSGELRDVFMGEAHYVHDMRPVYDFTPWRGEMPQDLIYGGLSHPVDALRWFFGDVEEVSALGVDSKMLVAASGRPYGDFCNYVVNMKFKNGVIARCLAAYGIVEPPMPMMGITLYGTGGTAVSEFSDFLGGSVKVTYDKFEVKSPFVSQYPPETEGSFGHGRTSLRYLQHFADCLKNDKEPQPGVREGAKTISTCSAAYESMKTGKVVKVTNDF